MSEFEARFNLIYCVSGDFDFDLKTKVPLKGMHTVELTHLPPQFVANYLQLSCSMDLLSFDYMQAFRSGLIQCSRCSGNEIILLFNLIW